LATLGETELAAAVAAVLLAESKVSPTDPASPWRNSGWMPVGRRRRRFVFRHGEADHEATFVYGNGPDEIRLGENNLAFAFAADDRESMILTLDGIRSHVVFALDGRELYLRTRNGRFELHWVDPFGEDDEEQIGEDRIVAPLPGTVVALFAEEGALLEKGAPIIALEVMKMEQTLRAPFDGKLKKIKCRVGDVVREGAELAELDAVT
jgi:3-methylcrotonyl-CoA carboxylase alpha subunit